MVSNNIWAGWGLKGQSLLIAEIFLESIDGRCDGERSTHKDIKLICVVTEDTELYPISTRPQSLLSNGICISGSIRKTLLQA